MQSMRKALLVIGLIGFTVISDAKAAAILYGFDQGLDIYKSNSLTTKLSAGSYFGFGSFYSSFDPTTITKANILSTLRDTTKWFMGFETSLVVPTVANPDVVYSISGTAATADNMYAYALFIDDTYDNVKAAISGSATGISNNFGLFTYSNTKSNLRYDLPRDSAFYADPSDFDMQVGMSSGFNNFVAVGNLGVVTGSAVALVPEPSSTKLLLVAALLALPWMRRTAKACKI